jgi:hypothetical protein
VDNNSTLLRVYVCSTPAHGTAVVNTTATPNTITYSPDPNFNGFDLFTYKISDGALNSSCVAVNVTVTPGMLCGIIDSSLLSTSIWNYGRYSLSP